MNPGVGLGERVLITVINCERLNTLTRTWLQNFIQKCIDKDDVFRKEFLEHVLITSWTERTKLRFPIETRDVFSYWGTRLVEYNSSIHNIPPGPYVGVGKTLWPAFRLYEDVQRAFYVAIKPCDMAL